MAQNKPKNKKHEHTKAAEEIKDKTASFRLTTNNYNIIKKKADEAKMSMSDYFLASQLRALASWNIWEYRFKVVPTTLWPISAETATTSTPSNISRLA